MNKERIKMLVEEQRLIPRTKNIPLIRSFIKSTEQSIRFAQKVMQQFPSDEDAAASVFKCIYDAIRKLGDAKWRLLGYEVSNSHGASMEILREEKVSNPILLQKLERFRAIRRNAEYQGQLINTEQAREIFDFWNLCGKEILENLKKEVL